MLKKETHIRKAASVSNETKGKVHARRYLSQSCATTESRVINGLMDFGSYAVYNQIVLLLLFFLHYLSDQVDKNRQLFL